MTTFYHPYRRRFTCFLMLALALLLLNPIKGSAQDDYKLRLPAVVKYACSGNIELPYIPPYGSSDDLQGRVKVDDPTQYRIAVYIYVSGWWNKPYWSQPLTSIRTDGTWTTDITTGGSDPLATKIAVFLVRVGYQPPLLSGAPRLPDDLFLNAIVCRIVKRSPQLRTLEFSGYTWQVKASEYPIGPGPNYFSDRPEDVWVDGQGRLHLRIAQHNGRWYATEVINTASLGHGIYTFTLASPVDALDPNAVLGLFTWDETTPEHAYREQDIEFSRWGDPTAANAQYVVQPWDRAGNRYRFTLPAGQPLTAHRFDWQPDHISFSSYAWNDLWQEFVDQLAAWQYTGPDVHPAGGENARINFWLLDGKAPTDGQPLEIIVESFSFSR